MNMFGLIIKALGLYLLFVLISGLVKSWRLLSHDGESAKSSKSQNRPKEETDGTYEAQYKVLNEDED